MIHDIFPSAGQLKIMDFLNRLQQLGFECKALSPDHLTDDDYSRILSHCLGLVSSIQIAYADVEGSFEKMIKVCKLFGVSGMIGIV
jgi:hypothetical protein